MKLRQSRFSSPSSGRPDGRIARMTHTTSKFGGEYDSLCDLVTFGVARLCSLQLVADFLRKMGGAGGILFVAQALRLARFNVQVRIIDSVYSTACPYREALRRWPPVFCCITTRRRRALLICRSCSSIALSLFMVSSIKYYSFKDLNFSHASLLCPLS